MINARQKPYNESPKYSSLNNFKDNSLKKVVQSNVGKEYNFLVLVRSLQEVLGCNRYV